MEWYVYVQNQAYGPYTDDHMRAFVAENRIIANSLISNNPAAGYYEAHEFEQFHVWNGTQQAAGQTIEAARPQQMAMAVGAETITPYSAPTSSAASDTQTVGTAPVDTPASSEASKVYLVMAEIRSQAAMTFLQTLQGFGKTERVGESVWLIRSQHSLAQIRNQLSQLLGQQDRLFLLDTKSAEPAWFNIGADLDHRIRELWDDEGQH